MILVQSIYGILRGPGVPMQFVHTDATLARTFKLRFEISTRLIGYGYGYGKPVERRNRLGLWLLCFRLPVTGRRCHIKERICLRNRALAFCNFFCLLINVDTQHDWCVGWKMRMRMNARRNHALLLFYILFGHIK